MGFIVTAHCDLTRERRNYSSSEIKIYSSFLEFHVYTRWVLADYRYRLMSSSLTALGVRMPRSVKSRETRPGGV